MTKYDQMFSEYYEGFEQTKATLEKNSSTLTLPHQEEKDKEIFYNLLKSYNETDGETGSFLVFLSSKFKSKASLLSFLKSVRGLLKNSALDEVVEEMIETLENSSQETDKSIKEQVGSLASNGGTDNKSELFDAVHVAIIARKYHDYSVFASRRMSERHSFPTKEASISTREFDNLSRQELVSYFKADRFYALSSNQRKALFQAVANDYLRTNGVTPCAVEWEDLPMSERSICFGQYSPSKGSISLNKQVLANLESADETNNQYLPYQMLSTVIHEAHHRVQFASLDKENKTEKEQQIASALLRPQSSMTYSEYLAEPDEVDARNASLQYIRECADMQKGSNSLAQFYNLTKEREANNSKQELPLYIQQFFPDVYSKNMLESGRNYQAMKTSRLEFNQIVHGKYNERQLAKNFNITNPF